jgi:prepilin-type N-terminal cleavage/methylation domain-containing protein
MQIEAHTPVTGEHRSPQQRGFSFTEVMISMIVLSVFGGVVAQGVVLSAFGRDRAEVWTAATEGARGMADRIAATPIEKIISRFGPGGSVGDTFDVEGLPGANQGSVTIVTNETSKDADIGMVLGFPRDLDGDGSATSTDVSLTARILPVIVTVTWLQGGRDGGTISIPLIVVRSQQ